MYITASDAVSLACSLHTPLERTNTYAEPLWDPASSFSGELISAARTLGRVLVLPQPYCILLEDISPGHQHIDLIYFARVRGGSLAPSERETRAARWLTWDELADPEINEDIRELGRRAIELCGAQEQAA